MVETVSTSFRLVEYVVADGTLAIFVESLVVRIYEKC